ncbi:MAG: 30S ribosomal protein S18 [Ignavibacteria bacterium]|nr:30S ribosomal protein S18 [Ignavibacteria bacterium]
MNAIYPMQTSSNFKNNKQRTVRKKQNPLKDAKVVDYLDVKLLQKFTNDQGKILPRRITGVTAYQQRQIAAAIKHARHLALMPFVAQDIA